MNTALMYGISALLFIIGITLVIIMPWSLESISIGMFLFSISILLVLFTVHFPEKRKTVELKIIEEKPKIRRRIKKRKHRKR